MFTGIVKDLGKVKSIGQGRITVFTSLEGIEPGDSVMVNGVCLTAVEFSRGRVSMDIGRSTLKDTALGYLQPGNRVNVEDSLTLSDKLGGHIVYGHAHCVGRVLSVVKKVNTRIIKIKAESSFTGKLMEKGSVAVDGVSLTVNELGSGYFTVGVIPETARRTNLGSLKSSDRVNLEPDMLLAAAMKG